MKTPGLYLYVVGEPDWEIDTHPIPRTLAARIARRFSAHIDVLHAKADPRETMPYLGEGASPRHRRDRPARPLPLADVVRVLGPARRVALLGDGLQYRGTQPQTLETHLISVT